MLFWRSGSGKVEKAFCRSAIRTAAVGKCKVKVGADFECREMTGLIPAWERSVASV